MSDVKGEGRGSDPWLTLKQHAERFDGVEADTIRGWVHEERDKRPGKTLDEKYEAIVGLERRGGKRTIYATVALIDEMAKKRGHSPRGVMPVEPERPPAAASPIALVIPDNDSDRRKLIDGVNDNGAGFVKGVASATDAYIGALLGQLARADQTIATQGQTISVQEQQIRDLRSRLADTG